MEFGWPLMLYALLTAPLALWAYVRVHRARARTERVLADPHLLSRLWIRPSPLRRHLPVALYILAIALLTLAMARPIAAIPLPTNRAAIILAVDVSRSMIGEDVKPSRLGTAQGLARQMLDAVPGSTRVGLVVFSDYAQILVPPTTERQPLREAIDNLKVQQATGVGAAIIEALKALPGRPEALGDRLNMQPQGPFAPFGPPASPVVPPSGSAPTDLPPAAVIILSDGISNLGVDPTQAAALAKEANVKIYTVGVGVPGGSVMTVDGQLVLVPFDPAVLQRVASLTGGQYYDTSASQELRRISRQLGRAIGWERRRTEVTALLAAGAGLVMITGAMFSLVWLRRMP